MTRLRDRGKKLWLTLSEAVSLFRGNQDLTAAASLAFSATLALIPALFLVTTLLSMAVGSSQEAFSNVQDLLVRFVPAYSQEILAEVRYIAAHKGTFGILNFGVLLLVITPLVSDLRQALGRIFRKKPSRPFLLDKLLDIAITAVFLVGISAIGVVGVVLTVARTWASLPDLPAYLGGVFQYLFNTAIVLLLYAVFSRKEKLRYLLAGALVSAGLWFIMRPLFHLFLAYNPGYGFAFGSFKSLFVVIIWIYYSLAVFLFGAEIAASLGRRETIYIKKLVEGKRGIPDSVLARYVVEHDAGSVIFSEGDEGNEMYSLRRGSVELSRAGQRIAVIKPGEYFGEMSFLLAAPRTAAAAALEDVQLVVINSSNIENLMNESPEVVVKMLKAMASRLRETNKLID